MIQLQRTDSANSDFKKLVFLLDKELAIRDGADHAFYDQFNKIDSIKYVVLAYLDGEAVGCGAIKEFDKNTVEVKRMFVPSDQQRKGIASIVLSDLENWAKELNFQRCILETGVNQPEAIQLYHKNNYQRIENYGQYTDVTNSLCFEKKLDA